MGFLADFIPFYPKSPPAKSKRPAFDLERALQVEVHAHPTLEQHRADSGELVLVMRRKMFPGEGLVARFVKVDQRRRAVLDEYGEFMLTECLKPGTQLSQVAERLAAQYDVELEQAKRGVIEMIKKLMLREFVFLVKR